MLFIWDETKVRLVEPMILHLWLVVSSRRGYISISILFVHSLLPVIGMTSPLGTRPRSRVFLVLLLLHLQINDSYLPELMLHFLDSLFKLGVLCENLFEFLVDCLLK